MKLGIDIDDTIANTFETGMKYAEIFTRKCCHREYNDIENRLGAIKSHRHWQEIFEWNQQEEEMFFKDYYEKILSEVEIKDDVCEIMKKLYPENDLIFITARHETGKTSVENLTKNWLEDHHIPFHNLYLGRKKLEICQENNIHVFIDDSYENCKSVQSGNIKSYLMDHITNRNIQDKTIERVYGWKDLYQKVIKYKEGR